LIARQPALIAGLVVALIVVKFGVLLVLGRVSRLDWSQTLLFAFALAQGGEFLFRTLPVYGGAGDHQRGNRPAARGDGGAEHGADAAPADDQ